MVNFLASTAFDVQPDIEESRNGKPNKYEYKANLNELSGILKDKLILAIAEKNQTKQASMVNAILDEAKRFVDPIRPYRSEQRNPNPRTSDFHHNL